MRNRLGYLFLSGLFLTMLFGCTSWGGSESTALDDEAEAASGPLSDDLRPHPDLTPEEVVKIQIEALQNNNRADKGIAVTFRFASPDNRRLTGPLNRFIRLVKNPAYRPMLNHKRAEFDPVELEGDIARQRVVIIGQDNQAVVYVFELSKQETAGCEGCWMTDSVTMIPTRSGGLTDI